MTAEPERDYQRTAVVTGGTRFLSGTRIEVIREWPAWNRPTHAIFDFDGTLSLIREGWPHVMVPLMVEELLTSGTSETPAELERVAMDFVMELTGKQTIFQMIRLAEEMEKRGGRAEDPLVYKRRYLQALHARIRGRHEDLRLGRVHPDEMLVPRARGLLDSLQQRGIMMYLASGTEVADVKEEARMLRIDEYFGPHIYGAIDNYRDFSKQMVIEGILRDHHLNGEKLVGFGDGYVEIDNVKQAGGLAIAVATDETHRSGEPDPWKRDRLIGVGADLVIPDFQDYPQLCAWIWNRETTDDALSPI